MFASVFASSILFYLYYIFRYLTVKYPLDQYPHIKRVKSGKTNGKVHLNIS
jgi:hypothetical protein